MQKTTKIKLLLCVPMIVIVISYIGMRMLESHDHIYLEDIQGNRDFLQPFATQLLLTEQGDSLADEEITITADGITRSKRTKEDTRQYQKRIGVWEGNAVYVDEYIDRMPAKDAKVDREVKIDAKHTETIRKYDKARIEISLGITSSLYQDAEIKPDFVVAPQGGFEEYEQKTEHFTEYRQKAYDDAAQVRTKNVLLGETIYTAILTNRAVKGNSGIYQTNLQALSQTQVGDTFVSDLFLKIPVDEQTQILDLETAGEHLALFTREGNTIILRLYDTKGVLLEQKSWDMGERIDDVTISKTDWKAGTGFVMEVSQKIDENVFVVKKQIYLWVERGKIKEVTFAQNQSTAIQSAVYQDLRLDISTQYAVPESWLPIFAPYGNPPMDYIFTVYDANHMVYQGQLVTDWNDDYYQYYGRFFAYNNENGIYLSIKEQQNPPEKAYQEYIRMVTEIAIEGRDIDD